MTDIKPGSPVDSLVCPRGHHSVEVYTDRIYCHTCNSQGRETRSWDRSELVDLRDEEPPLRGDREIVTDGGVSNYSDGTERRYWIKHIEDAGWGGKTKTTFSTVECTSVEVSDGLVRFTDGDGKDVFAIRAGRVIEYEERTPSTDTCRSEADR